MRLLVDSHILIWILFDPEKLSTRSTKLLNNAEEVYVSAASLWELAIKYNQGKLQYQPKFLEEGIDKLNLLHLEIKLSHVLALEDISLPHNDPFDKMLVAQAEAEGMQLLTADKILIASGYRILAN